jgi:uncharacterized cupin superfamily protein
MTTTTPPVAVAAEAVTPRPRKTLYPPQYAPSVAGREKRILGDLFGLMNFGVNLTRLEPGAMSALRHTHAKQDEFVYIVQGKPTLVTNTGETPLAPGMCAGFKAGNGDGHHLVNRTSTDVLFLEVGDRTPGDEVDYPDDDLRAVLVDGAWQMTHKDGRPW